MSGGSDSEREGKVDKIKKEELQITTDEICARWIERNGSSVGSRRDTSSGERGRKRARADRVDWQANEPNSVGFRVYAAHASQSDFGAGSSEEGVGARVAQELLGQLAWFGWQIRQSFCGNLTWGQHACGEKNRAKIAERGTSKTRGTNSKRPNPAHGKAEQLQGTA